MFWDIVRGVRPSWWARSANSDFPVGALLTREEWVDELTTAGFSAVAGEAMLGDASIGVVLRGLAHGGPPAAEQVRSGPSFRWEGAATVAAQRLQQTLLTIVPTEAEDTKATEGYGLVHRGLDRRELAIGRPGCGGASGASAREACRALCPSGCPSRAAVGGHDVGRHGQRSTGQLIHCGAP